MSVFPSFCFPFEWFHLVCLKPHLLLRGCQIGRRRSSEPHRRRSNNQAARSGSFDKVQHLETSSIFGKVLKVNWLFSTVLEALASGSPWFGFLVPYLPKANIYRSKSPSTPQDSTITSQKHKNPNISLQQNHLQTSPTLPPPIKPTRAKNMNKNTN